MNRPSFISKTFFILILMIVVGSSAWMWRPIHVFAVALAPDVDFFIEESSNSELQRLRREEHLDQVVASGHTDLDRVMALCRWTSRQFPASTPFPNYPPWNARTILRLVRHGVTGAFCAQYALVFGQSCQSLGYIVRYVDIADARGSDSHFLVNIYMPTLHRWIAFEPEFGYAYADEKGILLGVGKLHKYAIGKRRGTVWKFPQHNRVDLARIQLFYNYRYYLRNNFLSVPVLFKTHSGPNGTQWFFESYRLRWLDSYTAPIHESSPSLDSADCKEFNFPVDLQQAKEISCWSLTGCRQALAGLAPEKTYHLRLPWLVLINYLRDRAGPGYRFLDSTLRT